MAYFGITADTIAIMYPGASVADFGASDEAIGEEVINTSLAGMRDYAFSLLDPSFYQVLLRPRLELIVFKAIEGQTSACLGLTPIKAIGCGYGIGTVSNLRVYKLSGSYTDQTNSTYSSAVPCYRESFYELATEIDIYTVDTDTGEITFDALEANDQLYASYDVDTDNIFLSSLSPVVKYGTAYEVGSTLYAVSSDEWGLVRTYKDLFEKQIARIQAKDFKLIELERLQWLNPPQKSGGLSFMRNLRGS